MREIKFRGWHLTEKRIIDVRNINFWDDVVGYDCQGEWQYFDACGLSDVAIMQYTGLKDKNSKEIYEGDICKAAMIAEIYKDPLRPLVEAGEVIFARGSFHLLFKRNYSAAFSEVIGAEIIGNIYENPELLEIKK